VPDGTAQTVQVTAVLRGERADPARHVLLAEIKAVTYHRLSVEPLKPGAEADADSSAADALGWRATVLLDI
jgi:SHS2 domain-containing protein